MKMKLMHKSAIYSSTIILILLLLWPSVSVAQGTVNQPVSPSGALFRSLLIPGWGQYYATPHDWSRGKMHLMADLALLGSYVGIQINANQLVTSRTSFANQHAGIDLSSVDRSVRLYVAEFNSVQEYNDFQERSRNWNLLITDTYWNWNSDENRQQFQRLNNRIDQQRQQLPAIVSLMIINRVIAGIHAYSMAMQHNQSSSPYSLTIQPSDLNMGGYSATLRVSF